MKKLVIHVCKKCSCAVRPRVRAHFEFAPPIPAEQAVYFDLPYLAARYLNLL